MIKRFFCLATLALASHGLFAQATPEPEMDEEATASKHSIGVQANLLLKQLFSLNNSAAATNPYLLRYAYRPSNSRLEIQAGFGYQRIGETDNEGDKTKNSQLDGRVGVFRTFSLGKRFEASIGLDVLAGNGAFQSITKTGFTTGTGFDSTFVTSKSTIRTYGGGPRLNVSYKVTPKVSLGTEATFYYAANKNKTNVVVERNSSFTGAEITNENMETKDNTTGFSSPVILYLILHF